MKFPHALMIPTSGRCGICGKKTGLTAKCIYTGIHFGDCCLSAMKTAHLLIEANMINGGPRHPQPGEFNQ